MSDIKSMVKELELISKEIKRLNASRRKLNIRKKEVEARILRFLDEHEQAGVKYRGIAVIAKAHNKRSRRKEKDREADGSAILKAHGIQNSDKVIKQIIEAMKGETEEQKVLKLSTY